MAETTGIGWTDATFNPWVGCEKVSPGCAHCYAEELVTGRMGRAGTWGEHGTRERTSEANWRKPHRWETLAQQGLLPDGTRNEDGHRPRVFCASLADVFEPRPELEPWRLALFALIARTPSLDWQLLTKRPEFARDWLGTYYLHDFERVVNPALLPQKPLSWTSRDWINWGVLPNIWLGTSIENSRHTYRADALRQVPASVRFISAEPLLGSLYERTPDSTRRAVAITGSPVPPHIYHEPLNLTGIDWVIVGGESGGRDARPMHPAWAREIRDAILDSRDACDYCRIGRGAPSRDGCETHWAPCARPAFYFKQWGSWVEDRFGFDSTAVWVSPDGRSRSSLAADAYDDLPDGSVRMRYAGPSPKSGGKLLDDREWCEFPEREPVLA